MRKQELIICGFRRSGNTLLSNIIGSHSKIAIPSGNIDYWTVLYQHFKTNNLYDYKKYHLLGEFMNRATGETFFNFNQDSIKKLVKYFKSQEKINLVDLIGYSLELYAQETGKPLVGNKEPGAEEHIEKVLAINPDCKFIHIVRNPLSSIASTKRSRVKGQLDIDPIFVENIKRSLNCAIQNVKKHPKNYYVLQYEELVNEPEKTIKSICEFLNVDFEPNMLQMESNEGWRGTNTSFKDESFNGISKNALDRTNYLTGFEMYYAQKKLSEELSYFNYNFTKEEYKSEYRFNLIGVYTLTVIRKSFKFIAPILDALNLTQFAKSVFTKIKKMFNFQ